MELKFPVQKHYRRIQDESIESNYSQVYRAVDMELNKEVIIKEIALTGENHREISEQIHLVTREIKSLAAASNESPRVPSLFDYHVDEKEKKVYIIMQLIKGKTLRELYMWMDERRPSKKEERTYIGQIIELAWILENLASKSMCHRDIKPENMIISKDQVLCLIDFNLTIASMDPRLGTPYYKAPEMDKDAIIFNRRYVDMFSIGVMMYEFFTGILPVRGEHYAMNSRLSKKNREWSHFEEPKDRESGMSDILNQVIVQLMKYDPDKRYRNYRELVRDLENARRSI